jgi:hypothetical protein
MIVFAALSSTMPACLPACYIRKFFKIEETMDTVVASVSSGDVDRKQKYN